MYNLTSLLKALEAASSARGDVSRSRVEYRARNPSAWELWPSSRKPAIREPKSEIRLWIVCWSIVTAILVLPVAAESQVFVLALPGSCTGEVTAAFAGATPGSSVEVYQSLLEGTDAVPSGPCAGTALGLFAPELTATVTADASGGFSRTFNPPVEVCGLRLQTVDLTSCEVSNVARPFPGFPAPVPKTGQDQMFEPGDDGDWQTGVSWPDPRFTDNLDGTVTDNLSGLIWLQNANCFGTKNWAPALASANGLSSGQCGLTDGSVPGDWRLPHVREMASLIDYGEYFPMIPEGHLFSGVSSSLYWSSTTNAAFTGNAWWTDIWNGGVAYRSKEGIGVVWPVRGGE